MEVEGYVLEGIPRLKCLSITEIVLGGLGLIGALASVSEIPVSMAIELIFNVLVIGTGSYGVYTINKLRQGEVLSRRFSHLMKLNILVTIAQCLEIAMIVIAG
ncbi:uncharacterized protein LOC129594875, partial [Paramacrobiotus metropolitanus]|uniref:uncharacterized protein LOC129594875 n=1 Tax=Paramacrobiotus metropolitanus TaxID=2943436 RepID=UPI0024457AEA